MGATGADAMRTVLGSVTVNFDRVFFQVRGNDRERQLPGAPYDGIIGSPDNRNRDQQILAELGYTRDIGDRVTLAARAYLDRYRFTGRRVFDDTTITPARRDTFETTGDSLWYGGELRALADLLPTKTLLAVTAGVAIEATSTSASSVVLASPANPMPAGP